jgi:hypothetical protein
VHKKFQIFWRRCFIAAVTEHIGYFQTWKKLTKLEKNALGTMQQNAVSPPTIWSQ